MLTDSEKSLVVICVLLSFFPRKIALILENLSGLIAL